MSVVKKLIAVGASALLISMASGCASTEEAPTLADNDPNRVVCKSAPNTGSRVKKHDCRTVKQWEDMAAATDQINDAVRQRDAIRPRPSADGAGKQ